jgi:hypothetical protein
MNQRILLFIVIFLGLVIIVGTTVVITTIIERSGKVQFFSSKNEISENIDVIKPHICKVSPLNSTTEVIFLGDNRIGLKCPGGFEIIDIEKNKTTHYVE